VAFLWIREDLDRQDPCFFYFELDVGGDTGTAAVVAEDTSRDDPTYGPDFPANTDHLHCPEYVGGF